MIKKLSKIYKLSLKLKLNKQNKKLKLINKRK